MGRVSAVGLCDCAEFPAAEALDAYALGGLTDRKEVAGG